MNDLIELSSKEFLVKLASGEPTPGGGGGAAMAGALAAALASMVANLTIGKKKFAAQEAEAAECLEAAEKIREQLLKLVKEDAKVFNSFMACYRLPKNTEAEKSVRAEAICQAAKQAAEIPLAIAKAAYEVLQIAAKLVEIGNPGVITDGACSALLARAALRCAEYNVRINLNLTKDEVYNQQVMEELQSLLQGAQELEKQALVFTDKLLA